MPRRNNTFVPISERILEVISEPINLAVSNTPITESNENSIQRDANGALNFIPLPEIPQSTTELLEQLDQVLLRERLATPNEPLTYIPSFHPEYNVTGNAYRYRGTDYPGVNSSTTSVFMNNTITGELERERREQIAQQDWREYIRTMDELDNETNNRENTESYNSQVINFTNRMVETPLNNTTTEAVIAEIETSTPIEIPTEEFNYYKHFGALVAE